MASTDEPKRAPFKIDHIVAFIAADPETGDEGIIGTMTPNGCEIAREGNMRVTFCRFSVRTEEGIIDGRN
jgi:hypothetical protein